MVYYLNIVVFLLVMAQKKSYQKAVINSIIPAIVFAVLSSFTQSGTIIQILWYCFTRFVFWLIIVSIIVYYYPFGIKRLEKKNNKKK